MTPQLRDTIATKPVRTSSTSFAGKIWDVVSEDVDLGAAGVVTREFTRHPGAVGVLALDDAGRVPLVHQYRHPVGMSMWELPAGLLDVPGEPPQLRPVVPSHEAPGPRPGPGQGIEPTEREAGEPQRPLPQEGHHPDHARKAGTGPPLRRYSSRLSSRPQAPVRSGYLPQKPHRPRYSDRGGALNGLSWPFPCLPGPSGRRCSCR